MTATSKLTINLVVILLGVALLSCIGGAIGLTAFNKTVPDQLWTVGTTALGALAAILVSTRTTPDVPAAEAAVQAPVAK